MQLMAHASPKMTLTYAKLLDKTKRNAFDNAVKAGAFTFVDDTCEPLSENNISGDILQKLWAEYKLTAVDTPYGTCLQRKNGRCPFAKEPPCLSCNNGHPCVDLCVGAIDGDKEKYQILIESAQKMCDLAKRHGRIDMAKDNESRIKILQEIKKVIDNGGVIYGRTDRLIEQSKKPNALASKKSYQKLIGDGK